jgi:flagellar biosynthesis GTPase FlhF
MAPILGTRCVRLVIGLLLTLIPLQLYADEVILRDGRTLSGTILRQSSSILILRLSSGEEIEIPKRSIDRMRFAPAVEPEEKSEEANADDERLEREARRRLLENQAAAENARRLAEERRAAAEEARRLAEEARRMREEEETSASRAAARERQVGEVSRGSVLWRAALLPGWGHFRANEDGWGWTYTLGFWLSAATGAYYYNRAESFAKERGNAATYGSDSARAGQLSFGLAYIVGSSRSTTVAMQLGPYLFFQGSLQRTEQTSIDFEHLRQYQRAALTTAAALYVIQLIHAALMNLPVAEIPNADSMSRLEFFAGSSAQYCANLSCETQDGASDTIVGVRFRF